ncbi:MAG: ABC transporter ATP-binding protein [Candidatus Methanomethyliaceae archaeon]|nr:ABC transporter ATP-binding protein [Candidatus Methanomethyliaceae archaeon]
MQNPLFFLKRSVEGKATTIQADQHPSSEYALYVKGINKTYPNGIVANRDVSVSVMWGEVHAILGENGAGKTTLVKIISGCLKPDSGEIYIDGKKVDIDSPLKAVSLGIGMVHQHFTLIPSFTVAENIALSLPLKGRLSLDHVKEKIKSVSEVLNLKIDPDARIEQLPVGLRQRVEILRLLCQDVKILILDEPTSVLTPIEVEDLFRMIRELKSKGKSIIIITHKVREALAISDRVTIMRGGRVVKTLMTKDSNESELASLVVEGFCPSLKIEHVGRGDPILLVKDLKVKGDRGEIAVKGISLVLHSGEILGMAGVAGNGQKELVEAITGLRRAESGTILIKNCDLTNNPPKSIIRNGVAYIPEDRMRRGVILTMSVSENLVLKNFEDPPYSKGMIMDKGAIERSASELITRFGIKASDPWITVNSLSGGNIQKLVVARELSNGASILIAEQPTAGLDVKASEGVHQKMMELKSKGVGILLVSADLDEIVRLSDRILVIFEGRIVGEFTRDNCDIQKIARLMLGAPV